MRYPPRVPNPALGTHAHRNRAAVGSFASRLRVHFHGRGSFRAEDVLEALMDDKSVRTVRAQLYRMAEQDQGVARESPGVYRVTRLLDGE